MRTILEEFIADVEAVGVAYVEETWPELAITYRRATAIALRFGLGRIAPAEKGSPQ